MKRLGCTLPAATCLIVFAIFASIAQSADYNFIVKDGKYFLINQVDPSQPNKPVTVHFTILGTTGTVPPVVTPPTTTSSFEKKISKFTEDAIKSGGTPTTGAAISTVYTMVGESVSKGEVLPKDAVSTIGAGVAFLMTKVNDAPKWETFRQIIGNILDTLEQDGSLLTDRKLDKDKYAKILKEIASGMNSVTGFNGSLSSPQLSTDQVVAAEKFDLTQLIALIEMIIKWYKIFKGSL